MALGGRGDLRRSSFGSRPRGNNAVTDLKQQQQPWLPWPLLRVITYTHYAVLVISTLLRGCVWDPPPRLVFRALLHHFRPCRAPNLPIGTLCSVPLHRAAFLGARGSRRLRYHYMGYLLKHKILSLQICCATQY